ncbi:O-acyltransferase like protein-like [Hyposmocoma kahamanoa]|uniref:O-acyltransferase like protein-like n=1 Tax=Hyposmocoma kahamanoa TaxID=1477025 RepID=UPI000E6D8F53|nr:O-acyltransferase like protein-like [Hyposmocoma kahamanoa]
MMSIRAFVAVLCALVFIDKANSDQNNRIINIEWEPKHPAFDPNIYEEVLNPELCTNQLQYLTLNDTLLMMTFLEAGPRIPKGILQGNSVDLGNYHQCLGINREIDDMIINGKYCRIRIGLSNLQSLGDAPELRNIINDIDSTKSEILPFNRLLQNVEILSGIESEKKMRTDAANVGDIQFRVSVCIPKPCTTRQALPNLIGTQLVNFQEEFCRFKNDKPWAPGVYVAIIVFSLFGLLAILSTSYDIWNTVIQKRDPKSLSTVYQSFSVYTNSSRLITYKPVRDALECVDGIRAITMAWIIIGHTMYFLPPFINIVDLSQTLMSLRSFWLASFDIGVDTFFMLSGLLVVYTTVGKISNIKLLKKLHLFYLHRYLRMFPMLATTILLQVGVLHYIYDGAMWTRIAPRINRCRASWWLTLLQVQNFFPPWCTGHAWYLAIDMQLHILSPLILFFVLSGKKNRAWSALIVGLLVALTASSIYIYMNNFISSSIRPETDVESAERYASHYYNNTLTRCPPFFVGMCFGYLIHFEKNIRFSRILHCVLWIVNLTVLCLVLFSFEPMKNPDYDNQALDNFLNSFRRPAWSIGVGWLIFACTEGYGGPINWFLSLKFWKLPSRLSYAMYLLHLPIQFVIIGAPTQQMYFSMPNIIYIFCSQYVMYFIASFILTILVDFPCSNIIKIVLGSGIKKSDPERRRDLKASENKPVTQQQNELTNEHHKDAT